MPLDESTLRANVRVRDGKLEICCWLCSNCKWYGKIGNLVNHLEREHRLRLDMYGNRVATAQRHASEANVDLTGPAPRSPALSQQQPYVRGPLIPATPRISPFNPIPLSNPRWNPANLAPACNNSTVLQGGRLRTYNTQPHRYIPDSPGLRGFSSLATTSYPPTHYPGVCNRDVSSPFDDPILHPSNDQCASMPIPWSPVDNVDYSLSPCDWTETP
ncbi:hypothetical protein F5Y13DRAFT_96782 [Hypoxylon sp. FL1857]|nr:hypothetical protein F5Y13DRAFT_96782 [Hypoxylon sp. FL1857]